MGRDRVVARGEQDAADGRQRRADDEAGDLDVAHVDAGAAGRLGVAADRVDVPAEGRPAQQEGQPDHEGDGDRARRSGTPLSECRIEAGRGLPRLARSRLSTKVDDAEQDGQGADLGPDRRRATRRGARRRRRRDAPTGRRPRTRRSTTTNSTQPMSGVRLLFMIARIDRVVDPDRAALADDQEQHALQAEEVRQRDDERRDAQAGDQQPDEQADDQPGGEAGRRPRRPGVRAGSMRTPMTPPRCRRCSRRTGRSRRAAGRRPGPWR